MNELLEWQRVIRSKLNFLRAIEAVCPIANEGKSPVDKAAKVGVQVPAKANFFFFFNCLFTYDLIKNTIQDLIYR